jgi:integrase
LLADITDNEIADLVARRRAAVSESSVNRETQLLKRVFRRADTIWKVDIGDMPIWKEHSLIEPEGRTRELTTEEEVKLFGTLRPDFRPLIEFALMTGVRLGNARMLTWSHIDYDTRKVSFRLKSKKPGGRHHVVPISKAMLALLAEQRGHHPIYVFTYECKRSRGKRRKGERYPFSQSGWRRDWSKALKAAGIKNFRFHDLRHTGATRMMRVTGNIKVVQNLLGHANIASTARYAHATTADVRNAMELVQSRNTPESKTRTLPNPLRISN